MIFPLFCAGVCIDAAGILASRHTAGKGREATIPAASSTALCRKKLRPKQELHYALLRLARRLVPPCKGLPRSFSWIPRMGQKPGGHQAGQEHQTHQPEGTSPGGTPISHSNCNPFLQLRSPWSRIFSGERRSYRADGRMVAKQLLNQVTTVKPMPLSLPTLSHVSAHTEEGQPPPATPAALGKDSSLMLAPRATTKTDLHPASVIANPTPALSTRSFASSPSSPSQLLNPLPSNATLVLQHLTKKHGDANLPHPSYVSYFQVSFDAPNRSLAQVTIRSSSGIKRTLHIFFPPLSQSNKLHIKASVRTSGCCPSPMVSVGVSLRMPSTGTRLPFHGRGKAGSVGRLHAAR